MGKFGTQCCAFACSKRRKKVKVDDTTFRSDSNGTDDEESELKSFRGHFTRNIYWTCLKLLQFFGLRSTKYREACLRKKYQNIT